MLDVKMKEVCRICARELCGNQRRWIFHPASKLNLQVLLSHALGRELTRDGRGEFACSKCTFMLDRMYRFDTVIARVEALSLERLHKLLQEKDRLRQCIGGLYRKNNTQDQTRDQTGMGGTGEGETEGGGRSEGDSPIVDLSALQEARYSALLQDDLAYSVYESWADHEDQQSPAPDPQHHTQHHHPQCTGSETLSGHRSRRCRGCAALRVADSDYEAVCKVPRWVGRRSTSCGPSTRYSGSTLGGEETSTGSESTPVPSESPPMEPESDRTLCDGDPERMTLSPGTSVESLDTAVDVARPCATHREERERGEKDPGRVQRRGPHLQWDEAPRDKSVHGLTLELVLSLVRNWEYRPLKSPQGSKLPILVKPKLEMGLPQSRSTPDYELYSHPAIPDLVTPSSQQELQTELSAMEEQWLDDYVQCGPFRFQQRLLDEQQGKLSQYESAAGHCVSELQKAQLQVHSLQAKIRESEAGNQKLQVRLGDMECELRLVREEAQRQERNVLNLTDTINSKDTEAAELYRVIEEQNDMLCSLKDLANRNQVQTLQVSGAESVRGQGKVLALQGSLFQAQLELQAGQRAQRQATRKEEDLTRALIRLEQDLQGAVEHRHSTDRHNQDLHLALEKVRSELQQRKEQLNEKEGERLRAEEDMEKTIRELRTSLQSKEQLVQEYSELLDQQQGPREKSDSLLSKLKERIKERDRALERAVDEKFRCVEEKEGEMRRLQLLLREKERDLERQCCVLSNNEETIMSLEVLVRGKGLEQEQVCEAWRSVQHHHANSEERHSRSLRERDALISQLQNALHTRTKEAEDLTGALLGKVKAGPSEVVEEMKARLSLKEKLFQELLSDRGRQAQEHHTLVQDLLDTISSRDQYIQDSAGRLGEVMSEQTERLQELRRQLTSGSQAYGSQLGLQGPDLQGPDLQGTSQNFQALQDELRLALRREREAQAEITALRTMTGQTDRPVNRQAEFGEFSSEEEDDVNSDYADSMEEEESKLTAQTLATMQNAELHGKPGKGKLSQHPVGEGQGLVDVKQLVQQKRVVERELQELKVQLEKAGFSSLSQMRKALFNLRMENKELNSHQTDSQPETDLRHEQILQEEEDEEEVDEEEEEEELCGSELWEAWDDDCPSQGKCCAPRPTLRDPGLGRRHCTRPASLDLGAMLSCSTQDEDDEEEAGREAGGRRHSATETVMGEKAVRLQLESKELKERLMVSEATVQAQAEQLKDYRDLLKTSVQQDSKQVQVDLQDMGYETCGRSENEANREETSSPEFDDLEMCTSLECGGSQWWSGTVHPGKAGPPTSTSEADSMTSLQRLVEDLRSQLSRSQTVIRSLQGRLRSLSTSSELSIGPSIPRKVNWGVQFQASPSQSGPEEDEGWESSGGGLGPSPRHPKPDKDLQELVSRVGALEDQLRKGKGTPTPTEEGKATSWPGPGKFNTLIQAQARELSHLRQRMREGRGVCHILTQHLGDTTKAFEELLRANDIDYYMGQSFREQLAQSSALAQRVSTKISGRDHPKIPDDKTGTELLAIRLSKELQQKDDVIDSLRAKLTQHQPRSDTPCSSHALSDTTDQSDHISFVSDEQGSTNEDLEPCSDIDAASEYGQEDRHASTTASTDSHCNSVPMSRHPFIPPSTSSSHGHQSSISCPSLQRSADTQTQTGLYSGPVSSSLPTPPQPQSQSQSQSQSHPQPQSQSQPRYHSNLSSQRAPLSLNPQTATLRPRYHGSRPGAFSLAEVHQELQMLQRQLGETERFSVPSVKPFGGFPMSAHPHPQTDPPSYMPQPLSYHTFHPAGLNASLNASPAMKAGASLLENSAMWDMAYGARSMRVGTADLSSGSSGYQSGTSHTGSDLIKEHLREIRSLRQRLDDSIQTNDLLRQQLEERLVNQARDKCAPTNIYIQGLDSVSQLSSEIRVLKAENLSLQDRLQQASRDGSKEAEQLREAVLLGRARVKEAELETERWAEQGRRLHTQTQAQTLEITHLKQDRQNNQETINRLQHDVNVLQQQLCESRGLAHSLQYDLQICHRVCGVPKNTNTSEGSHSEESAPFDPRDLHVQLGQQLTSGTRLPGARIQLFHDPALSTPVRDTGLFSPASPLSLTLEPMEVDFSPEGQAPDGSFANRNGHHVVGHVDDFSALQQQILEGRVLIGKMEAALRATANHTLLELSPDKPVDPGCVRSLLTCSTTLRKILEDASSLLRMFWREALPNSEGSTQSTKTELSLKQVHTMRQRISEQEEALKDAMERLKSSNRTKDSMEHFIVSQLSRTKDVLKKARTNLEENEQRMSSLGLTSFPSSSSSSSHPWVGKGENPRGFCELTQSAGWGIVKPHIQATSPRTPTVLWPNTQGLTYRVPYRQRLCDAPAPSSS
ncbi:myomegalin isoform X1 [Oncorhynchus kisutch]|uniref:myomegalin isoform X1 n=1 Tax=Oncorhynchus kisutch TaxID=8019 RepID=UPI0012DFB625|nr:myomegalin-like isoform X1 [Oncorhynchus kisutch]